MVSLRFLEESTVIIFSAFIASAITYFIGLYPQVSLIIMLLFLILSFILIIGIIFYDSILNRMWASSMENKLINPIIGIIHQDGCIPTYTSFSPTDWRDKLVSLALRVNLISVSEISDKFAAIINPYGEVYPEEELLTLRTFERIKKYIADGGIFLCAGGLAFFYGGDVRSPGRNVALADELQILIPAPATAPVGTLIPTYTYPPNYSINTLLQKNFGIVNTWRNTERSRCFQNPRDREFVGDVANQGGIDEVLHFRAIREPVRRCLPFLRVQPHDWTGDVYVIAGVPYKKGCLILNGFDLRENPNNTDWNALIHRANIDKICYALKNLLENRQNGNIDLNAENW